MKFIFVILLLVTTNSFAQVDSSACAKIIQLQDSLIAEYKNQITILTERNSVLSRQNIVMSNQNVALKKNKNLRNTILDAIRIALYFIPKIK